MRNSLLSLVIVSSLAWSCGSSKSDNSQKSLSLLKQHTEMLSHDSCMGRKPFSEGADKAVKYLSEQMKEIGLKPYSGDSYYQNVEVVLSQTEVSKTMTLSTPKGKMELERYEDFTGFTKRLEEKIDIENAPMFFAGYGIVAPEYGKDDYSGIKDIENKIAIVLVNDPGLGSSDKSYFKGDEMTYYGRWMYKYEQAAKAGAKGVLIIHEDRGAGYGWSVVQASAKSKLYVAHREEGRYDTELEGWITQDVAKEFLEMNGYKLEELMAKSKSADFKPFDLSSKLSVSMNNSFTYQQSPNVVGYIEAKEPTQKSVVYTAHWDHLGVGKAIDGDSIINGTSDNATAMAWMLEIARRFKESGKAPDKNIVFLSPTCEETGFLGSIYYTQNPLFDAKQIAAVINFDVYPLWGESNDVTITGYGHSNLDSIVGELASEQGRYVMADPESYNGMFFRSDHFPFVKLGIPAMFAKGWSDSRKHGKEWSQKAIKDYWATTYHKPKDQNNPATDDYRGLLQEVDLFYQLGDHISNMDNYPKWSPTSEFAQTLIR